MEQQIKKIVDIIKKDRDVVAIILFGSYLKNKKYARDVDICVILEGKKDAKKFFRKRMDYLSRIPDKFDIQIFQLLPLNVRIGVLREGKILYLRNKSEIYNIAYETIKDYALFENYYKDYINYVK